MHLHEKVYDIKDGFVKDLDITIKDNNSLSEVYQLDL